LGELRHLFQTGHGLLVEGLHLGLLGRQGLFPLLKALLAALQLLLLALDFIPASLPALFFPLQLPPSGLQFLLHLPAEPEDFVSGLQLHIPPSGLGLLQDGFRLSFGLRQKDVRA